MSKRNTFLDASDDVEEDILQSDVEDVRDSRFASFRAKQRKLSPSGQDGISEDGSIAADDEDAGPSDKNGSQLDNVAEETGIGLEEREREPDKDKDVNKDSKRKILTKAKLEKAQKKIRKTGVIYISRVPPFMNPSTLRTFLAPYGTILRIFLTPEPAPRYQARVRAGGNKKKSFVDGWVEFESKKKARVCAEALNGNLVGGKKGGFYHDDIWNIKYLKGFKWNDLMEQVQGEEREREGRVQAEIEREKRERKAFLRNVELAKVERGMEAKRKKKRAAGGVDDASAEEDGESHAAAIEPTGKRRKMEFKQNVVRSAGKEEEAREAKAVPRTLSKIL